MKPKGDLRELLACSCFAARRAARVITQHHDHYLKPTGLRATQLAMLTVLSLAGPMPLTTLADQLGTERTTVTRNLRLMLERGYVAEGPSDDRRVRMLAATPRGTAAAHAALPHWRKAQSSLAASLGPAAIDGLHTAAHGATRLAGRRARVSPGRE